MAHRLEIELLHEAEIQELRAILTRTLPYATRSGAQRLRQLRQLRQRPQTILPPERVPAPEPTAETSYLADLRNDEINDTETTDSPGFGVGTNSSAFERGEDMILMDSFSDEQS